MSEIKWHPSTAIPEHGTKAFVFWVDADRAHTASWFGTFWITSAGYKVYGMGEVKAWAHQPSIKDVLAHGIGEEK